MTAIDYKIREVGDQLARTALLIELTGIRVQLRKFTASVNWDRQPLGGRLGIDIEKTHRAIDMAQLACFTDKAERKRFAKDRGMDVGTTDNPDLNSRVKPKNPPDGGPDLGPNGDTETDTGMAMGDTEHRRHRLQAAIASLIAKLDGMDADTAEKAINDLEKEVEELAAAMSPAIKRMPYGWPAVMKNKIGQARQRRNLVGRCT